MRIAIVGSRNYMPLSEVVQFVRDLPEGTIVISGDAPGVDKTAQEEAERIGLEVVKHPAQWQFGAGAGFIRNREIVKDADEIVAFWDGKSRGTADTIRCSVRAKKRVVVRYSPYNAFQKAVGGDGKFPNTII